jgi:hypothetical protein
VDIEAGEESHRRRAGVLVISVWVDELGPGEFLATVRAQDADAQSIEHVASESELLAVVRAWLRGLTAHHAHRQ